MCGCVLLFVYSNSHLSPPPHHRPSWLLITTHCHLLKLHNGTHHTLHLYRCLKEHRPSLATLLKSHKRAISGAATETQFKKPKLTIMVEQELGGSKGKGGKVGVKKGPKSAKTRCVVIRRTDIYYADPPLVNRKTSAAKATEAASTDAGGPPDHLTP